MVQREDVRYPRDQAPTVMTVAYGWGRPLDRMGYADIPSQHRVTRAKVV